jgi:hypothetical protein
MKGEKTRHVKDIAAVTTEGEKARETVQIKPALPTAIVPYFKIALPQFPSTLRQCLRDQCLRA